MRLPIADASIRKLRGSRLLIVGLAVVIAAVLLVPYLRVRSAFATVAQSLRQELGYSGDRAETARAELRSVCRELNVQSGDLRLRRRGSDLVAIVDLKKSVRLAGLVPVTFKRHLVLVIPMS